MPAYYLGQSLVLVGQPDAAAEAFERAITRKPNRNDLLDIFQALGRVYQRAQRTEKALDVWNRLEKLFPDDARVQEQIATTLVEEGQFDQALPRLEKLADADRGQVPPVDVPHGGRRAEGEAQEDARGAGRLREAARPN